MATRATGGSRGRNPSPRRVAASSRSKPAAKSSSRGSGKPAGKASASPVRRSPRQGEPELHWSREASGLTWAVLTLMALFVAYSGLFGGLGRAIYLIGVEVAGPAAWTVYVISGLAGLAVLLRMKGLPRWPWSYAALLELAVCTWIVVEDGALRAKSLADRGLVSGTAGRALVALAGTSGALIILAALAAALVAALAGVRVQTLAPRMVSWLLSGAPEEAAKPRPREPEPVSSDDDGLLFEEPLTERIELPSEAPIPAAPPIIDAPVVAEAHQPPAAVFGPASDRWRLPKLSLLGRGTRAKVDRNSLIRRGQVLQGALSSHGVAVSVVGMTVGPTVTRYELELGEGVKVARVLSLQRDIAYAMAAADVRILAPIPGKSAIGVEVPNQTREIVTLGDVFASSQMARASRVLEVPLGQDIAGVTTVLDLATMPHVLIAGSTGSGKSSLINSVLVSLLVRNTPRDLRMILVDPKRVELSQYSGLPHLLTQVVVDPKKAAHALNWAVAEMERRYDILANWGVRDIAGYRQLPADADFGEEGAPEELPYILVVVDELNDLMMAAPRDVEDSICRIAQKARAVGVHLVLATQRPSVDVITGVIKTNVPSRIAFAVASQTDSRVILDQPGAEKLVGRGDMLVVTAASSQAHRLQAPWVAETEVASVVGFWRRQGAPSFVEELEKGEESARGRESGGDDLDELFGAAARLVVESGAGSTSMLQRRLKVGFARAGRLMDLLEEQGIVGPPEGSKQRQVLVSVEELMEMGL